MAAMDPVQLLELLYAPERLISLLDTGCHGLKLPAGRVKVLL